MISLIIWLVLGFVVGLIAKVVTPGTDGGGIVLTTVLGIAGAVVGGLLGQYLLGYPMISSFENIGDNLPSFVSSIIGAVIVLLVYRFAVGRGIRG